MPSYYDELAAHVAAQRADQETFPEAAFDALRALPPDDRVEPRELLAALARGEITAAPGRPGLIVVHLAAREGVCVEVRFWIEEPRAHRADFRGALHLLAGSALHAHLRFDEQEQIDDDFRIGTTDVETMALLQHGEAHAISEATIFPIASPTIALVVRQDAAPLAPPRQPHPPWFEAAEPRSPVLVEQLRLVDFLFQTQHRDRLHRMRDLLERADFPATYHLLARANASMLDSGPLATYVELARPRHGARIELIPPVIAERRRRNEIVERRAECRVSDHRYFLALLLEVPTCDRILSMVRMRIPDRDPVDTIAAWVAEPSVLGLALGEDELRVFRLLLQQLSPEELLARLRDEYEDVEEDALDQLTSAMRSAPLLRPLFAQPR